MIFYHPGYNPVRFGLWWSKDLSSIIIVSSREMYCSNNFAMHMPILSKARYENNMLKPTKELPLKDGESVLIEIRQSIADKIYGILSTDKKTADEIIDMEGLDWISPTFHQPRTFLSIQIFSCTSFKKHPLFKKILQRLL
jgi:predicted DNA-binding antitoxin AbrB/MazE fold protein